MMYNKEKAIEILSTQLTEIQLSKLAEIAQNALKRTLALSYLDKFLIS